MDPLNAEDPATIGPFRLLGRLGVGGMGRVYLARSAGGRAVAVKVVHPELATQDEFRRRFAREVAALERVGGAGTAPVLGADTGAELPWVAVGYVPGPSLRTVVAEEYGPLPPASVRTLAAGLARALTHVHAAGLVHRDLKPSNVLLTVDGPRIIDFGIARALDAVTVTDGGLTSTGAVVGSPGFMSPEQVRGERVTPASDIFCLGSVLAYAATGRSPFGSSDSGVHATMFRIANEEPDLAGLAPELAGLIRACLTKDPEGRPSAAELVDTLQVTDPWLPADVLVRLGRHAAKVLEAEGSAAAGTGDPTPATPLPPGPTAAPPRRRRRGVLVAAVTALVVAAAGALAYTYWPGPGTAGGAGGQGDKTRGGAGTTAARPSGIVPAAFLGAWEGILQGSVSHPRETLRLEITQGAAGSKSAVYVHVTDERLCMGRSRLVSADEDKVVLGESDVTTSVPAQRCTPSAQQTLTLRSPEVLEWTSGAAKATFRKGRTGSEILPAKFLGSWRMKNDPTVFGKNVDRYTDEVTLTQGPIGSAVFRYEQGYPRTDEEGNPTSESVHCTFTALLAGSGTPLVVGPQTAEPGSDPECGPTGGIAGYLDVVRYQGEDRLLVYPMTDAEPGEFHKQ
ncbi:serine/threonine-protein kinase [Streptomyces sp. NPDC053493]|uniref:serine/threonine-protein kinase n=1 Tax=Streptomyces sp. NPDC053493 TaxID=3365705 RepID=UPI0037D32D27